MKIDAEAPDFEKFSKLVDKVLAVPREEMNRRLEEYRVRSKASPVRRGPKPKSQKSAKA